MKYPPQQLWSPSAHKKLQALGATTLLGVSLISCSPTAPNATSVTEPMPVLPTAVPVLPTATPILPTATAVSAGQYIDGTYLGDSIRTERWGSTQVHVLITDGMLVDVEMTEYPHSKSRSAQISAAALPILISEAITNQDAHIDILSRATDVSIAFIRSLDSALSKARVGG